MERDKWLRAAWRVGITQEIDPERLLFVDEMGANTSLHPLYAWSKRGERARCSVPRNRGKNTTLLASMSVEGIGPSLAITGAIDARVFEAYLERVLLPELGPGRIVVMDNLSVCSQEREGQGVGRGSRVRVALPATLLTRSEPHRRSLLEGQGHPAQGRGPRARKTLVEALGPALSAITEEDARGFFEHCGYVTPVQSL